MERKREERIRGLVMLLVIALGFTGCNIVENFDNCPQQEVSGMFLGDSPGGLNCLANPSEIEIYTEAAPGTTPPFLATIWASLISTGNALFTAVAQTVIEFEGGMETLGVDRVQILLRGYGAPCVFIAENDLGETLEILTDPYASTPEVVDVTVTMIGSGTGERIEQVRIIGYECEQDDFQAWANP